MEYAGFDACVAANLDLFAWYNGGYPKRFMEKTIAWHGLHGLIDTHVEDARQTAAEKEAKRARRK